MDGRKLVKMANEIAAFFEADPDRAVVLEGIANHLEKFWDPRMRSELLQWVEQHSGERLNASALEAIKVHRHRLAPKQRDAASV